MPSSENVRITIDVDNRMSEKLARENLPRDLVYLLPGKLCTETASCEEGDHTYSWPCDFAPGTGQYT